MAKVTPSKNLILQPSDWRILMREELLAAGLDHDTAGVVARRVVERLVRGYLGGRLEPSPPATHQLDEAA